MYRMYPGSHSGVSNRSTVPTRAESFATPKRAPLTTFIEGFGRPEVSSLFGPADMAPVRIETPLDKRNRELRDPTIVAPYPLGEWARAAAGGVGGTVLGAARFVNGGLDKGVDMIGSTPRLPEPGGRRWRDQAAELALGAASFAIGPVHEAIGRIRGD